MNAEPVLFLSKIDMCEYFLCTACSWVHGIVAFACEYVSVLACQPDMHDSEQCRAHYLCR